MASDQFDEFWEIRCPKCNEIIDIEILVNSLKKKIENLEVAKEK
jgi:phage FluMu protein Com